MALEAIRMIVVTAPSGQIGHQVVARLLADDEQVRLVARKPAVLDPFTRDRAEIVAGSHADSAVLDVALDGADTLFWLVPPNPQARSVRAAYVDFTRNLADRLPGDVKRVVIISALGHGIPGEAGYVTGSHAMEELITATGVHARVLAMPSFMDNIARQVAPIAKQGVFFSPIAGDRSMPSVATRDIAAVAAQLLRDETWIGQQVRPVLGPEDLSFNDMAHIMSEMLGTEVRFQRSAPEAYKDTMRKAGMSEAMAQGMLDMALAKDRGIDNAVQRAPDSSTPTTFRQWVADTLTPAVHSARDGS